MMESSQRRAAHSPVRRSRNGCRECRRRHRRCDEAKPSCSYCQSVSMTCEYSRELSWGGRPFKKSRFGKCIDKDQGLVAVPSQTVTKPQSSRSKNKRARNRKSLDKQFVYTWMPDFSAGSVDKSSPVRSPTTPTSSQVLGAPEDYNCPLLDWSCDITPSVIEDITNEVIGVVSVADDVDASTESVESCQDTTGDTDGVCSEEEDPDTSEWLTAPEVLTPALIPSSQLSSLSHRNRSLLDYFQHDVCLALSCHDGIPRDLCSALIPMAQDSPHLMAAMLCVAASRRYATGHDQTSQQAISLRSKAIHLLSNAIDGHCTELSPAKQSVDTILVALSTSLVLCISEIVSSEGTAGGWRVYLSGASALMERLRDMPCSQAGFSISFVKRLYTSIKAVSVGCGLRVGKLHTVKDPDQRDEDDDVGFEVEDYIDDFAGFSTSLIPIFEKIYAMNRKHAGEDSAGQDIENFMVSLLLPDWRQRLIERLQLMLIRRKPRFRPEVASSLSLAAKTDFWLLDEAYHHMALLCLYCQQLEESMIWYESLRQSSIDRIIACIGAMDIARKPGPGAAILPPLFTAGCAAVEEGDIVRILALLRLSRGSFGMGNVMLTQKVLEARWEMLKEKGGSLSPVYRDEGLDFLPY